MPVQLMQSATCNRRRLRVSFSCRALLCVRQHESHLERLLQESKNSEVMNSSFVYSNFYTQPFKFSNYLGMFLEDGIRKSVKFLRKALRVNIIM
jgi:hypothetical protein